MADWLRKNETLVIILIIFIAFIGFGIGSALTGLFNKNKKQFPGNKIG